MNYVIVLGGGASGMAAALRAEYDVDEPTALRDAQAFLDALRQLNIV